MTSRRRKDAMQACDDRVRRGSQLDLIWLGAPAILSILI
jgi:hypothetical protein